MRNLKKALSLALASAMLLGMMVVGTSAAYSDVASTDNVEAIEVLQMVGVMSGDENGNFNPDKKVTRNEMAVIMSNLMDLKTADFKGAHPFTDVPAWADDFVSACYANAIVSGASATEYNGDGSVTAAEAALMLMKALGYFQYQSDFADDWMLATVKQASKIKLFDGIDAGAKTALTRNEVAQLVLNAMESGLVDSVGTPGTVIEGNGLTITTGSSVSYYYTTDPMTTLYADLYEGDLVKNPGAVDNMGRPAVEWTYTDDGETDSVKAAEEADLTYVISASDMNTLAEIVTEDELTVAAGAVYYVSNNAYSTAYTSVENVDLPYGRIVEMFKDSDGKIEKVVTYDYTIVEITDVEAYDEEDTMVEDYEASVVYTIENLAGTELNTKTYVDNLSESKAGYQEIGTYAKGDVLAIVLKSDGTILAKEAAKTVDGVKTASGTGYVKVDGEKFVLKNGVSVAANYEDTWTYYLDPKGTIIDGELKEEAESALEYVYVLDEDADTTGGLLSGTSYKAAVEVMYLDGTTEIVNYAVTKAEKDIAGTSIVKGDYYFEYMGAKVEFTNAASFTGAVATGAWAAYTKNDAGEITLKSVAKDDVSESMSVTVLEKTRTVGTNADTETVYANTSTKVTILDEDGVAKVYTGYKNFPAAAKSGTALVIFNEKDTVAKEIYLYDASYTAEATEIDVVMYVSKGDTVEDGTVVNFYENGKPVSYTVANASVLTVVGQLVELDLDSDNIATATVLSTADPADYTVGVISVVSDDYIVVGGSEVALADDCEAYLVNAENKVMSKTELATDDTRKAAVFTNSDSEAYLVIIYKAMPAAVQ